MLSYMYLCFPGYIKKLLHPVFSKLEFCPNARVQEEATFLLFLDFLEECEGRECRYQFTLCMQPLLCTNLQISA